MVIIKADQMDDIDKLYIDLEVTEKLIQKLTDNVNDITRTLSSITLLDKNNSDFNKNNPVFSWESAVDLKYV